MQFFAWESGLHGKRMTPLFILKLGEGAQCWVPAFGRRQSQMGGGHTAEAPLYSLTALG